MYKLTYNKYLSMSTKARISWCQEKLIKLGYLEENTSMPTKRDKPFIKAVKKLQEAHNFTTNAEVHEQEFDILNGV